MKLTTIASVEHLNIIFEWNDHFFVEIFEQFSSSWIQLKVQKGLNLRI